MKESQTVGRDINSFCSVKILYCTIAGPMVTQFLLQESYGVHSNRSSFSVIAILAAKSEF